MTPELGQGRTALITGASSGIGLALAKEFAAHGFSLVLTARRAERLDALARTLTDTYASRVVVIPADLALPESPQVIAEEIERQGIAIDALVNNAGYGVSGLFIEQDWATHRDFLRVLLEAPCALTHRFLPGMRARNFGRILNVASLAGFLPATVGSTLYPAVKTFLISFSQSLALELTGTGIHVTALCPGLTHTEFHDGQELRADIAKAPAWAWMSAQSVAKQGFDAVMRNQPVIVPGPLNALGAALMKRLPNAMALALIRTSMKT